MGFVGRPAEGRQRFLRLDGMLPQMRVEAVKAIAQGEFLFFPPERPSFQLFVGDAGKLAQRAPV